MNSLVTTLPGLVPIFVPAGGVSALAGVLSTYEHIKAESCHIFSQYKILI